MGRARRRRKARLMYIKFIIFIILFILAISLIKNTFAKYRSTGSSNANVDLAFYLFQEQSISQDIKLASILPRVQPYNYTFSVANNNGTDRTDTALTYTIELKTTTNLPLNYAVYTQSDTTTNLITSTSTTQDDDGTYFKYLNVQGGEFGYSTNESVNYILQVEFPQEYAVSEYEAIVEYIQITINSSQKI